MGRPANAGSASVLSMAATHSNSRQYHPLARDAGRSSSLKTAFAPLFLSVVMLVSCPKPEVNALGRQNSQPSQGSTKVLAVYMPWFGDVSHLDVGYSSHDPRVLRRQIEAARSAGISAFLVDWYGDRRPFLDKGFRLLQRAAKEKHFQVALMYNETENDEANATDDAFAALLKAYTDYIGPQAPDRDAYLTYNGRPVIVIFPKQGHTDWTLVRERVNRWAVPPLLLY